METNIKVVNFVQENQISKHYLWNDDNKATNMECRKGYVEEDFNKLVSILSSSNLLII